MYTIHPPPIIHSGNVVPKPYKSGTLPRNYRHSTNTVGSSTLPRNFNLNMNKRSSMPANAVTPTSRTSSFNLLHNVIRQQQQQEQLQQQKQLQQKNRTNANRKVHALEDENGYMVTIPASDKPTQLFVRIPSEKAAEVPDFILNNQSSQIRRKSKAFNARLQEGDEIVNVNGRNCQNVSRDVTMSYVDGAKESLDLEVIRRDKNFNTVNASTYNISNNNPNITTGKTATIQLAPSGTFQAPGRPASMGSSVRQTTNTQSRIIPVENRSQTITRTVTQKVGDEDAKTSTTTEVKHFGPGGQETTSRVINTGGHPQQKPVVFQPKIVANAKPSGWSPSQQPQKSQPNVVRVGQKTTINLQGSFDEEQEEPPKSKWAPISKPAKPPQQPWTPISQPAKPPQPAWNPTSQPAKPPQPAWAPSSQPSKPAQPSWMAQQHAPKPQQQTWSPHNQPKQPESIRPGQRQTFHFQGNYNEPPQEAPKDLAALIPSQSTSKPSLRPSLAKPQSVSPTWHPPSSHAPPPQEEHKRWSAPVKSNVGKEMTITFGGPGQGMKIPIGIAAPMSMAQTAPSQQSTVTKFSTRTVTTLEETAMDDESSEEELGVFRTPSPNIPVPPPVPQPEKPFDIMDDPSVILRGLYKPPGSKDAKKSKGKMLRPKSYPGAVVDEIDLDETDKMKVCKNIADLLMFPKNKSARGAKMFAKQRKRSAKYTIEAYGIRGEDEELPEQIGPKVPIPRRLQVGIESPVRAPKIPPAPAPPPPPPPTTEPIFIPKLGISITPTDFSITKKKEDKCQHKTVSPIMCGMLVADLKGTKGRGASMFERRRKRSEKFVLTNEGQSPDAAPITPEDAGPAQVTLEFIARHGSEEAEEPPAPKLRQDTPVVLMKSPWEAAAESPIGSIDSAFKRKQGFTGVDSPPQQQANRPKPPAEWMKTSSMLPQIPAKPPMEPRIKPKFRAGPPSPGENGHMPTPEPMFRPKFDARKQQNQANYMDFNKRARGWGGSPKQSPEDTPPSMSPASVHSGDMARGSPGLGASFPTQPLKYGGGYNNFNNKPRSFAPSGGGFNPVEPMESDEL